MKHNVQFKEDQYPSRRFQKPQTGMVNFLVAKGIAKDVQQASIILLTVIIILLLFSGFVIILQNKEETTPYQPDPSTL